MSKLSNFLIGAAVVGVSIAVAKALSDGDLEIRITSDVPTTTYIPVGATLSQIRALELDLARVRAELIVVSESLSELRENAPYRYRNNDLMLVVRLESAKLRLEAEMQEINRRIMYLRRHNI